MLSFWDKQVQSSEAISGSTIVNLQNLKAEPPTSQTSENSILNPVSPSPELKEIKSQLSQLATSVHNHQKHFDSEKHHQEFPPKLPSSTSEKDSYNVVVYGIDEAPSQTSS